MEHKVDRLTGKERSRSAAARVVWQFDSLVAVRRFVASLDVLYDIGGESRIFPFVAWSDPDASARAEEFSERVEYAGRFVAEQAVSRLRAAGEAVYFIDNQERLVKQTADGRRFEVRVTRAMRFFESCLADEGRAMAVAAGRAQRRRQEHVCAQLGRGRRRNRKAG
ncbi:MAG TPA: hypothetical protein VKV28_08430 [Candidatus Binataceae bacterium]|nr:hypothetical protein [Candidatus Binataceae bacterium]